MTGAAYDGPTLVNTSDEARAGLLRFGSGAGCQATRHELAMGPVCGQPGRWHIAVEDARAGVSTGWPGTDTWTFSPAETTAVVCDEHLAEVQGEPRRVFWVSPVTGDGMAPHAGIALIRLPDGMW